MYRVQRLCVGLAIAMNTPCNCSDFYHGYSWFGAPVHVYLRGRYHVAGSYVTGIEQKRIL